MASQECWTRIVKQEHTNRDNDAVQIFSRSRPQEDEVCFVWMMVEEGHSAKVLLQTVPSDNRSSAGSVGREPLRSVTCLFMLIVLVFVWEVAILSSKYISTTIL